MTVAGPIAAAISISGEALEKAGQKLGWWDQIGAIKRPLPPTLLTPLPAAEVKRPILFVPGWQTPKDRFDHLLAKLTEGGANGGSPVYVANGQFFSDMDCRQPLKSPLQEAKVFVACFPATNTPPHVSGPDLRKSLEAIENLTGQAKVDVAAYSMGGLATQVALDQGHQMGKVMMLATPNEGSSLSRSALGLLDLQQQGWNVAWLCARKPVDESDREALGWGLPMNGGSHNEQLSDLRSRWWEQRDRAEAVQLLGSNSRPTFGRYFVPAWGDGTVTEQSLRLPDTETHFLKNPVYSNHGLIFSNPETYLKMRDYFGWGGSAA
jgi:pimeloyl-ACP methyl ester carboxylesterase